MNQIKICWKHHRQLYSDGKCMDCGDFPPPKPKAYSDSIKKSAIALSYAFGEVENEGQRQSLAERWEVKLRELIKLDNYEIVEVKQ